MIRRLLARLLCPLARIRRFAGLLLTAGLLVAGPIVHATPADDDIDAAENVFWWGDVDELDARFEHARAHPERRADGWSEWGLFERGTRRIFHPGDDYASEAYYNQLIAFTEQWATARPRSRLARLFHARALFQTGWWYRGGEFVDKVPAPAWQRFREKIAAAIEDLRSHADLVAGDNLTNQYLIDFGRSADWSLEQQWVVARQALDRKPDDYLIYRAMVTSSGEHWGGSAEAVDAVVQEAVRRTRDKLGLELYAKLYYQEAARLEGAFFRQTRAEWPKIRQGFRDALAHWSSEWDLNDFAYIACLARDKETATELIDRIAGKPVMDRWPSGRRDYEQCAGWAKSP